MLYGVIILRRRWMPGSSPGMTARVRDRRHELDLQRRPAEDSQLPQPARVAGESLDQVSGDRPARVLQGRRGQPVRHPELELPHAHGRGGAAEIDLRRRDLARHRGADRLDRSAQVPRRAPLRRPSEGRAHQDRPHRRDQGRPRQARRHAGDDRRAGLRFHGRLARHGGGRGGDRRARDRGRSRHAVHHVRGVRRRAHAGGHPLADAIAAHHGGGADAARRQAALHRRADQSDHRRRHRVLCHAGRRAHRRARRADRLRRPARDRADHPREIARGLPEIGISAATTAWSTWWCIATSCARPWPSCAAC